jgi:hypothetical protein
VATIKLELDIPDWTVKQLQQAVADIDALDDEVGIAAGNVRAPVHSRWPTRYRRSKP